MRRVLIEVLADVVPDRVLHLRRLRTIGAQARDLGAKVRRGDRDRRDLLVHAQREDVVVDEAADLLAVEGDVEGVALPVPAASPDLDHAEELGVALERQRLRAAA